MPAVVLVALVAAFVLYRRWLRHRAAIRGSVADTAQLNVLGESRPRVSRNVRRRRVRL